MINFLHSYVLTFSAYCSEIIVPVFFGFIISGIIKTKISEQFVYRYLGEGYWRSLLMASLIGVLLPVCCLGSLPIALTLKSKGARSSAVLAFLITTPATSLSAIFLSWRLLGLEMAVYIACSVVVMGLIIGAVGARVYQRWMPGEDSMLKSNVAPCCNSQHHEESSKAGSGWLAVLKYAFVTMPREIGLELLLTMTLAAFIMTVQPIQDFIGSQLSGWLAYPVLLVTGLVTYVCSTASVPITDALIRSGASSGASMAYLIAGPVTSFGTILIVKKQYGSAVMLWYIASILLGSFLFGLGYDVFFIS